MINVIHIVHIPEGRKQGRKECGEDLERANRRHLAHIPVTVLCQQRPIAISCYPFLLYCADTIGVTYESAF